MINYEEAYLNIIKTYLTKENESEERNSERIKRYLSKKDKILETFKALKNFSIEVKRKGKPNEIKKALKFNIDDYKKISHFDCRKCPAYLFGFDPNGYNKHYKNEDEKENERITFCNSMFFSSTTHIACFKAAVLFGETLYNDAHTCLKIE